MKRKARWGVTPIVAVALGIAASCGHATQTDDSQTHWLERCESAADCGRGQSCECGYCVQPCDDGAACASPSGAESACFEQSSGPVQELCPTAEHSVCFETCEPGGCGADQTCSGGACVPSEVVTGGGGEGGNSGNGGTGIAGTGGEGGGDRGDAAGGTPGEPVGNWSLVKPWPTAEELTSIWVASDGEAWAAGWQGTVLYWNGDNWSVADVGTTVTLNGVWGSGPEDVWITGDEGTILHFDGDAWETVDSPTTDTLGPPAGSGPTDIWIPDYSQPGVWHWDGSDWSFTTTPAGFGRIAAVSTDLAFATAGDSVYQFDGQNWIQTLYYPDYGYKNIFATESGEAWLTVVDLFGAPYLFHRTQGSWEAVTLDLTIRELRNPWADGEGAVWFQAMYDDYAYNGLARYVPETGEWTQFRLDDAWINQLWGSSPNNVMTAGPGGTLATWDGDAWSTVSSDLGDCFSVDGISKDDAWALCSYTLEHWDGQSWTSVPYPEEPVLGLTNLAVAGPGDVFIGFNGGIVRYQDGIWTDSEYTSGDWRLSAAGPDDVWAFNEDQLIHFDGDDWTPVDVGFHTDFLGLWARRSDDVWVATQLTMLHWDTVEWKSYNIHTQLQGPVSIHSTSPTNAWLAARANDEPTSIWHWDGVDWLPAKSDVYYTALVTFGPDDVFALAGDGTFSHYDGEGWTDLDAAPESMWALWGAAPRDLFAGGRGLLRYR